MASLIAAPIGSALDVTERQDLHLVREVIRMGLKGLAIIPAAAGAADLITVATISAASVAGYIVYVYLSMVALSRHPKMRLS